MHICSHELLKTAPKITLRLLYLAIPMQAYIIIKPYTCALVYHCAVLMSLAQILHTTVHWQGKHVRHKIWPDCKTNGQMDNTKTKCVLKQNKAKHTCAPKQTGPKNKMGLTRGGALNMTPTHLKENKKYNKNKFSPHNASLCLPIRVFGLSTQCHEEHVKTQKLMLQR